MQQLRAAGIPLAPKSLVDFLLTHENPQSHIDMIRKEGKNVFTQKVPALTSSPGRVIAPIVESKTEDISMRNNMPDWRREDFPMDAVDAIVNVEVHYDITGNSITEGKMGDINDAFNDRLERLRKLIIANSRLPRRPLELSLIHI